MAIPDIKIVYFIQLTIYSPINFSINSASSASGDEIRDLSLKDYFFQLFRIFKFVFKANYLSIVAKRMILKSKKISLFVYLGTGLIKQIRNKVF